MSSHHAGEHSSDDLLADLVDQDHPPAGDLHEPLKQRQLAHATDKTPAHYEEDHYREKVLH